MPETQGTPAITGVHTLGIPVTDQDRAVAFYVDTLGLGSASIGRSKVPVGSRWHLPAPPSRSRWNGPTTGTRRVSRRRAPGGGGCRCHPRRPSCGKRRRWRRAALARRAPDVRLPRSGRQRARDRRRLRARSSRRSSTRSKADMARVANPNPLPTSPTPAKPNEARRERRPAGADANAPAR